MWRKTDAGAGEGHLGLGAVRLLGKGILRLGSVHLRMSWGSHTASRTLSEVAAWWHRHHVRRELRDVPACTAGLGSGGSEASAVNGKRVSVIILHLEALSATIRTGHRWQATSGLGLRWCEH